MGFCFCLRAFILKSTGVAKVFLSMEKCSEWMHLACRYGDYILRYLDSIRPGVVKGFRKGDWGILTNRDKYSL